MNPSPRPGTISAIGLALIAAGCHADGPGSSLQTPPPPAHIPTAEGGAAGSTWDRFHADEAAAVGFPQHPSISPDGKTVVFAWAGDLWSVPSSGGAATRLTAHPASEGASAFSPDGTLLAFESDRDGPRSLFVMPIRPAMADGGAGGGAGGLVGGAPHRVTVSDRAQTLGGFSADGRELLFSSSHEPSIYRSTRMYRAPVLPPSPDGSVGSPLSRITDAYGTAPRATHDGRSIVFSRGRADFTRPAYRGSGDQDLFRLDLETNAFTRLTTFEGTDGDAFPLPDGSVVFISSRDGQNNLWKLAPGASDSDEDNLTQLTHFQPASPATVDGSASIAHGVRDLAVSRGGQFAVFAVWDTLYRLDLSKPSAQPEPIPLLATSDTADLDYDRTNLSRQISESALSPDGKTLAVIARGEVFIRSTDEGRPTRRVTDTVGRERDLAWSPDGRILYFASDDTGNYSIYQATVALSRDDLNTAPEAPKPQAPAPETPAPTDPKPVDPPPPAEPPGTPNPNPQSPPTPEAPTAQPATEPDPKAADEPGDDADKDDPKKDDKKKDDKKGPDHGKRWQDSLRFTVEPLIDTPAEERTPSPSPDGKGLLFVRNLGDLILRELASGEERVLFTGWDEPEFYWAGDSRHIVYARQDLDFNSDIFLLDTAAEELQHINLTRHPDMDVSPRLSADGKVLVFLSERAGENFQYDVYALNLDEKLDGLPDYELTQYYKDAAAAAKKRKPLSDDAKPIDPYAFDTDNAYLRTRRLTSFPGRQSNLQITPAADRIAFTAEIDGRRSFISVDHKGDDRKTVDASSVGNVSVSLTGDKFIYLKSGQVYTAGPTGGKVESLPIDAPVVIDVAAEQKQKFLEAARTLGARFYHPTLKGLDWPGLTERYLSLAMKTRTSDEFNRVVGLLFGELDGSHLGISGGSRGGSGADGQPIGYLGIDAEPAVADGQPGYRITRIITGGPAARRWSKLEVGETIIAIDGRPLGGSGSPDAAAPTIDLGAALAGKANQETLLELVNADGSGRRYALITPMSSGAHGAIRYEDEIAQRRALVSKLSDNRLGYLHIRGMSETYVRDFERDLFAAGEGKEGLIIDVRDNGGGSTADILLSSLTAPRHATTVPRGADPDSVPKDAYPRDRRLIYAWTRPINVLINENSFSNAEIFAHAIKNTNRGTLIGTPTYGGVISTGGFTLIDGTFVRMPFRGWYLPDGQDMENNGAQPDVPVPQTPQDEAAGKDTQLEAAVNELLDRLNNK